MFETIAWNRAHHAEVRRRRRASETKATQKSPELRPAFFLKHLRHGQTLFAYGEPKECVYRVESGTIRIIAQMPGKPAEIIEEISRGVIFGLGNLDHHVDTAIAVVDSTVSFWPRNALPSLVKYAPQTEQRQFDAIEREFVDLRATIVASTANSPLGRVAAFLSYLSQTNGSEGRDPEIIDDAIRCTVVADYLNMEIATLGNALRELERQEIVAFHPPHGLRIRDLVRLDRFAPPN